MYIFISWKDAIFSNLNLEISPGSTIGVVGATGAGKTTLLRMLLRFCDPNSGKIEWCGKELKEWKLESLRSSIALVEQNVTLFPATIKENILYGKQDASDAEVEEAAKVAEISDLSKPYLKDGQHSLERVGKG